MQSMLEQFLGICQGFHFFQAIFVYTRLNSGVENGNIIREKTKMESCLAVGKEEEKLTKKYKAFREHTQASLEDTLKHLSSLREELSKGT